RKRYWLDAPTVRGDLGASGVTGLDHPLLGGATDLGDGQGLVLTGRLSLRAQPWLADHAYRDTILLPGTAFVEMAVRAGDEVGCDRLDDLTIEAPVLVPSDGSVVVQVIVGPPDETDHRALTIYSRVDGEPWVRHASGALAVGAGAVAPGADSWPPAGAEPVDLTDAYPIMAERGYGYGPAFQGLRTAWRHGEDVYAEVELPASEEPFGLHPALLDAALHPIVLGALGAREPGLLPFSWQGVALVATGASALRVRLRPIGADKVAISAWDPT
ncbi:polyketide synthase dehydratase domain-containing protein, partial [Nocardia takedensis]|uniref:polyketide synthase dehydratase domain-containing protein n=1 Tax=Nocardia takedensis TaxID=259390 RepID=UPI0005926A2F